MPAAKKIKRLNRLYAVSSGINEAIVRIPGEQQLFEEACRIAVERGEFMMAWVGRNDPEQAVLAPVARWGRDEGYVDSIRISTDPQRKEGLGPGGTAFRTGEPAVSNDIESDSRFFAFRNEALAKGYRSCAAFPLKLDGRPVAVFFVYSSEPLYFNEEEMALLSSLTENFSFAMDAREKDAKRQRAEEEILRLNTELEQRVRHRTLQLELANQELQAFSYSVAHDLRAPLAAISGFGHALDKELGTTPTERARHYLSRMREGAARTAGMIDALLSLAQLTRTELRWEPVDLSALALQAAQGCRDQAPERDASISIQPGMVAHGDPRLLTLVLDNLIGNAWKFTALVPRAEITMRADPGPDGEVVYCVSDNGVGFDMAYASNLFGAFQRLHASDQFAGSGIGLANVRRIISRHSGRVWADSRPGEGARFHFSIGSEPA